MNDPGSSLFLLRVVKLVLEIALLALVGQGVVWAMIRAVGADPSRNVFYRALEVVASPFVKLVRLVTPKVVSDRHVPWAALGLLLAAYVATQFTIVQTCVGLGLSVRECLGRSS
ncbi:MAG TPA: hypothetical protein VFX05_05685 [Casimicrobiaceae bacterium]|nr:hypothetical protein [Casimicrobiaceae bacterium]